MNTRVTLLATGAAMIALTAPAAAQHDAHEIEQVEVIESAGGYDGEWQGNWQEDASWRGMWNGTYTTEDGEVLEGSYIGTFRGQARFMGDDGRVLMLGEDGWHESDRRYESGEERLHMRDLGASPDGRLGYTLAQREAWLADCRVLMSRAGGYYDYNDYYRDDADSGLIGGLLGAAVGGFAGNRIADGDRLAGTVIGAGIGGIAGAVIGSIADGGSDDADVRKISANELYAARYCEAYLRRYEMSGGAPYYGHMAYGQPGIVAQTFAARPGGHGPHGHRHGPECTTTVREEWVEVETPAPAPRPARRAIPPRPQAQPEPRGKTVPID